MITNRSYTNSAYDWIKLNIDFNNIINLSVTKMRKIIFAAIKINSGNKP